MGNVVFSAIPSTNQRCRHEGGKGGLTNWTSLTLDFRLNYGSPEGQMKNVFPGDSFSKSDLRCFLLCVYDRELVEKRSARINFPSSLHFFFFFSRVKQREKKFFQSD